MGFLGKVFGKGGRRAEGIEAPPCPHTSFVQRWDRLEEMGKPELALYVCDSCGNSFSYREAQEFTEHAPAIFREPTQEQEPSRKR